MSEYVVLTDSELGHEIMCSRQVAEDFLNEFKDINDGAVYIKRSISTCDTVDKLKEEYRFAIENFMENDDND